MQVLVISADQFEDSELIQPVEALEDAGAKVDIASLEAGTFKGKKGAEVTADRDVAEVNPEAYDLLLLPGGKAPASLRQSGRVLELAKAFMDDGKPIAAICHGPQILISAGVVEGRTLTSFKAVGKELEEAGAHYVDRELVTDGNLITSRHPGDLPVFIKEVLQTLRQATDAT